MNLIDELAQLSTALDQNGVEYALCGGLAMAVHAKPRATVDIDLLVTPEQIAEAKAVSASLGFDIEAHPMVFAKGKVPINRVSKIVTGQQELLSIDYLIVTDATQAAWHSRQKVHWDHGPLWVVSKEGLILLKKLRGSGQDQDDIRQLEDQVAEGNGHEG